MTKYFTKEQVMNAMKEQNFMLDDIWGVEQRLDELPVADVVPVVHARWEETDWETWSCTHCGIEWQFLDGMTPEENDAFYCPHCGARMDGR